MNTPFIFVNLSVDFEWTEDLCLMIDEKYTLFLTCFLAGVQQSCSIQQLLPCETSSLLNGPS